MRAPLARKLVIKGLRGWPHPCPDRLADGDRSLSVAAKLAIIRRCLVENSLTSIHLPTKFGHLPTIHDRLP